MAGRLESNRFIAPQPGWSGRLLARVLNCHGLLRLRRRLFSRLPFPTLRSDVRDVVYLNWMVDVARVAHLVPGGLRLWERGGLTPLTVLSYRHGGFGPEAAGPARRLFGSPLQSNWRLYLQDEGSAAGSVLFLSNIVDSALYAASSRLCSDALPTHLAAIFRHEHMGDAYTTEIDGGCGSAPDIRFTATRAGERHLPDDFAKVFPNWNQAVGWLAQRDSAVAKLADGEGVAMAGISLPIDVATMVPLDVHGPPHSRALLALVGDSQPFGFAVPTVTFRVLWERLLPMP